MKIGFLAMSGVRAHDPELLELGLTLPGFVERSKVVASLPSLGLLYLAAVTPQGHELVYMEAEGDRSEPDEVYSCDLVAISTFSAQIFEAYAIADRLRQVGIRVAIGGLHASVRPDEALEHVDYVIIGEGENVWPDVVTAAELCRKPGVFDSADYPPVQVKALPVPRYDLLGDRPYSRYTVQATRGCPWRCDFCASSVMLQRPYRKRPIADVVRDIRAVMEVCPEPFIEFADDNTFVDREWGKELCRALEPLNIKWFTESDIRVADDDELLELMARAGCRQVLVGLESPTADALSGVERHADFKRKRVADNADAIRRIQSHGITVNGCFVLGLDGHTPEVFQNVYDFAMDAGLYDVQVTYMTAFPGTPLYQRLESEGRIVLPDRWDLCTLFDINYEPVGMTREQLREGMFWLAERLYSDETTRLRRRGFFRQYRSAQRQRRARANTTRAS